MHRYRIALAAPIFIGATSTSFAATTIHVVKNGEGGGPMSLAIDQSTVKAGDVVFAVHNDAAAEKHEMVLVKLKSATMKLPSSSPSIASMKVHSTAVVKWPTFSQERMDIYKQRLHQDLTFSSVTSRGTTKQAYTRFSR